MIGTKRQQWEKASDTLKICRSSWVHYLRLFVYRPSCLARYIILNAYMYTVLKCPNPKCIFLLKWIFAPVFPSSNKSCHFIGLETCKKKQTSFVHDWVRKGVGLFLIWYHNLCMHVYKVLMWCKSVCDVKSGIDLLPFWFGCEQKIRGFSQVLKPIKWQDLLEEGKNGPSAFPTGAKIHFLWKLHFWVRDMLNYC